MDEEVIKCKGRFNNVSLFVNTKNFILLLVKYEFIRLLIKYLYEFTKYSGIRDILTILRERYWVLCGREVVKGFIRSCVICFKYEGLLYGFLFFDDLFSNRVLEDSFFIYIGFDFVGSLYVETKNLKEECKEL